jgi:hypothetical protein
MTAPEDHFFAEMKEKSPQEKADFVLDFIEQLPKGEQKVVRREVVAGLGPPSDRTRNAIWLIIVGAFAIVLLGSAGVLGRAVFLETTPNATYFAKIETVVTVFTSVLAFLSGLLAPSPVKT